jgi:hypothetical protein
MSSSEPDLPCTSESISLSGGEQYNIILNLTMIIFNQAIKDYSHTSYFFLNWENGKLNA